MSDNKGIMIGCLTLILVAIFAPVIIFACGWFGGWILMKIVGDAVYSNAHDGVKVPEWVKKKTLTVDGISKDGTRVRLMPIWSWTYIKYVQKV